MFVEQFIFNFQTVSTCRVTRNENGMVEANAQKGLEGKAHFQTSLQSKTDAIAVVKLLKTMTVRRVLISKDNNDFHDILLTLVTK